MTTNRQASRDDQQGTKMPQGSEGTVNLLDTVIEYPSKSGRDAVRAVDGVTASIRAGERFVILGPSGCGKSTLLSAIAGFLPVTSGSIEVSGNVVKAPGLERVMVFQELNQLLPWRTVKSNIAWGIRHRWRRIGRREAVRRAEEYITLVDLEPQAMQFPNTLSGGQKQRVALARSFAVEPQVLLMDEPFGALDAITREKMQGEVNRLWQKSRVTIVFVTHDVDEAVRLGDRIMVMTRGPGRIQDICDGLPEDNRSGAAAGELVAKLRSLLS